MPVSVPFFELFLIAKVLILAGTTSVPTLPKLTPSAGRPEIVPGVGVGVGDGVQLDHADRGKAGDGEIC